MKNKKSNTKKLVAVLAVLAACWLAFGTIGIMKYRDRILNLTDKDAQTVEKDAEEPMENEADTPDFDDEEQQEPADDEAADEEEPDEKEPEDEPADDDESDDEDQDKEEKDEDDDEEKDYVVMKVQAPDNFAAVRAGRGTQYDEVGRITNGHRVALKDLENGWYKIAKGKYKGYYTHQSSFVAAD